MRLRQLCQKNMDKPLLPSGVAAEEWATQKPVYINKKFKPEDPSEHSFRKSSCLLKKCRVTALFINLIKNLLELMKKEQIKPRPIPYSVETISSLESMPYPRAPNRIRGRKSRPRCLLCPGAQHSTCIPRRRVISMTPASACCKVGKCYNPPTNFCSPCLPPPANFCPFHRHSPCPMRPCVQRPTTPPKSKFPHKRESYMHVPCDPCQRKMQCGGCLSVTQLPPPCCPRPIPCLEPMPSCYDCPALAPCQPRSKTRAKPKLSRPNLCKRQCVLNPCKRVISSLECSGQCTTATTTSESDLQVQRVSSCHRPCIRPQEICIQQEVNTDNMKYCISTQTSIAVFPEVRCGPSYCCTSQPKVAQTGPSRYNVVQSGPSQQICAQRSQVQFNQAVQIKSENFKSRTEVSGPKNCSCQAGCEPVVVSNNMYQPLATGVFIRFPDMVPNGCYGVQMPTVVASTCPMGGVGGTGGTMQERRLSTQDPGTRQWEQSSTTDPGRQQWDRPSTMDPGSWQWNHPSTTDPGRRQWDQPLTLGQAVPARRNSSDGTTTNGVPGAPIDQLPPSSLQGQTLQSQEPQRTLYDSEGAPAPRDPAQSVSWSAPQGTNAPRDLSIFGPPNSYKPQRASTPTTPQGPNGSLGPQYVGIAGPNGPYGPQYIDQSGPYDPQLQPDAARGAYGPQQMYTSGMGPGRADASYDNTGVNYRKSGDDYYAQPLDPGITASSQPASQRQAMPGTQATSLRNPYGQQSPGYGPQSRGIGGPAHGQDAPPNAYHPRFVSPEATTGYKSVDPYDTIAPGRQQMDANGIGAYDPRSAGQVAPNVANSPQLGISGQNGRTGTQYGMENNTPIKAFSQSPYRDRSSNPYDQQLIEPVGTNAEYRPQTSGTRTRFIGVDESSSQTETYSFPPAAPTVQGGSNRQSLDPSGTYRSPNLMRAGAKAGPDDLSEIRGVYGPVRTIEPNESQVLLVEPDTTNAGGETEPHGQSTPTDTPEFQPTETENTGRSGTCRKSITPINGTTGFKSRNNTQARKSICKPKRFYCTQSGQTRPKDVGQAVDVNVAGAQSQGQREGRFGDKYDAERDLQPLRLSITATTGTGQQLVEEQEQYDSPKGEQIAFSPQATISKGYNPREIQRQTSNIPDIVENNVTPSFRRKKKSVNYNPQVANIRDSLTPEVEPEDAFRPQEEPVRWTSTASDDGHLPPKFSASRISLRRRQTKGPTTIQRTLATEAEVKDNSDEDLEATTESQDFSKQQMFSNIRRKSIAPNSMRQHHATDGADPNQAVRISSNALQRTVNITPFSHTSSAERTTAPSFSHISSAEPTNAQTIKRPSMTPTTNKSVRLSESKGQTKPRSSVTPPRKPEAVPAKRATSNQLRDPSKPVQSRSASPQRKGPNQSPGSAQSKKSKRKTSIKRKSAEKVEKAKELFFDNKIYVKPATSASEDDRAERAARATFANKHRGSYESQDTGLQALPRDVMRPNIDMGTSISQQSVVELPPKTNVGTYGLCKSSSAKRRGSDLGGILSSHERTQDYSQLCEYSSGEEGDHGTSNESINSKTGSIGEEIICTKLSEKTICIKSSGTDPPEDTGPCWSQPLGSLSRPITRLHPYRPRLHSPCDSPCEKDLDTDCFMPPCHRKLPYQKRLPRLTIQNRPPWQNINTGRNARRPSNSTAIQPLPPCQRIPPWPELCPARTKSPSSAKCQYISSSSPRQSPCRISSRYNTHPKVSCRCSKEDDNRRSVESLECRKGKANGYPCSATSSLIVECQCPSKGTKECKCFHVASSLQILRQVRR